MWFGVHGMGATLDNLMSGVWFYVSGMGATLVYWLILRKATVFDCVRAVWVVDIYICVCV